jgi:stage II sporulation protein D
MRSAAFLTAVFASLAAAGAALASYGTLPARTWSAPAPAVTGPAPLLQVALATGQSAVNLTATGAFSVHDGTTGAPREHLAPGTRLRVVRAPGGMRYRPDQAVRSLIAAPAAGALIVVNGRPYRGRVDLQLDGEGAINAVNVVDVESYLYGVVRAEMPAQSAFEALKSQAIASRTYALKNRDCFRAQGFGLKANEQSQVYGGVSDEDPRTSAAVDQTRGIVLSSKGELIEASFHSSCGGQTEHVEDVWATVEPLAYLRAVACYGCRRDPTPDWSVKLDLAMVAARLRKAGHPVGRIRGIWAIPSRTGRVREIVVQSDRGTARVPGNAFRLGIDRKAIKSLLWDLQAIALASGSAAAGARSDGSPVVSALVVTGRGNGHGLGLCQHGAMVAGGQGSNCWDILRAYYMGAEFSRAY